MGSSEKELAATLAARWSAELTSALNKALEKGHVDQLSVFEPIEGRMDLRGLLVSVMIKHRKLEKIDFSHSTWKLAAQFLFSELQGCLFDYAEVGANLDHKFFKCSFLKAKMARVVLRGLFQDCNFTGASMREAAGSGVSFVRCSFKGANLKRAHLLRCSFEECDFSGAYFGEGSLSGSTFKDSTIERSALGNTLLERVTWS